MNIKGSQLAAIMIVAVLLSVVCASVLYGNNSDSKEIGETENYVVDTFVVDDRLVCNINGENIVTGSVVKHNYDVNLYISTPSRGYVKVTMEYNDHGGMGPGGGYYEELVNAGTSVPLDGSCWFTDTTGTITVTFTPSSH